MEDSLNSHASSNRELNETARHVITTPRRNAPHCADLEVVDNERHQVYASTENRSLDKGITHCYSGK